MFPEQKNDYGFLPAHPMPHHDFIHTPAKSPDVSNVALALVALVVIGAMIYGAFYAGRMSAARIDEAKIAQAYNTGFVLGGLCRADPNMAACSPESLRTGHVL